MQISLGGMGTDFGGTIVAGAGNPATLPCCTPGQGSDPSYSNSANGDFRYSPVNGGTYCNPNCVGTSGDLQQQSDINILQQQLNALYGSMNQPLIAGVSNSTLFIGAGALLVLLLVLKR